MIRLAARTSALVVLSTLALGGSSALATTVTGQTTFLGSPPLACTIGSLVSPNAYVWNEQTGVTTSATLLDEIQNPGGSATPVSGIVTGTYDSFFIHFDSSSGVSSASGTVTFTQPIVGAIFMQNSLDLSDPTFGSLGTVYPTLYPFRTLGASSFSYIGNVLTFNFQHVVPTSDLSQIRVLTHVPAPGAAGLLGLSGAVALRRRRRSV